MSYNLQFIIQWLVGDYDKCLIYVFLINKLLIQLILMTFKY